MDDSTISYIKFIKEVIPVPDPPTPDPIVVPDINTAASTKSSLMGHSFSAFPQTGDPAWWALMAAFVFGVLAIIMAICIFFVPAVVAIKKSNYSKPKFSRANAAILIGFSLAALLSCGLYYSQTLNNADAESTAARHVFATGEITCTLGPSGQTWTQAQLINMYDVELILTSVNTQAINSQLKDLPLNIKYNDTVLFNGKIGDNITLSKVLLLKPRETINLTYSIPTDIDYDKFNYDANAFSVEFVSTGSPIQDLVVDGTMYYPALSNTDPRWNEIRWYDTNKNLITGLTCMTDIVTNNIRFYSIDEPSGTTFKGIRVDIESFKEAFGDVPYKPYNYDSKDNEPLKPYMDTYVGNKILPGENCETLNFNKGITIGQPDIDGVLIEDIDAVYAFSVNKNENYYWTAMPAFRSQARIGDKITSGRTNFYSYAGLGYVTNYYPEPERKVYMTRNGAPIEENTFFNRNKWRLSHPGNCTAYELLDVNPTGSYGDPSIDREDADLYENLLFKQEKTTDWFSRYFAYAWPVKRNTCLQWGPDNGYAWIRTDSAESFNTETILQYMSEPGDNSDGPDKINALVVFSRNFGTGGPK